jgi:hypothetical protein
VIKRVALLVAVASLASCSPDNGIEGYDALSRHVENNPVGGGADQWIEMVSVMGTSERVGLIFGYMNDRQACLEAIAGMQAANPGREYVCTPAN